MLQHHIMKLGTQLTNFCIDDAGQGASWVHGNSKCRWHDNSKPNLILDISRF
jgi:hypothetical protein